MAQCVAGEMKHPENSALCSRHKTKFVDELINILTVPCIQPESAINAHLNSRFLLEFEPAPQKQFPVLRHKII
jgi:hypothetical protein